MILQQNKNADVTRSGALEEGVMSIDVSSQQKLMRMLSEGLYKDSIGSTIREWASNALDSHVEAGVIEEPIIVEIEKDSTNNWCLKVTDVGVGISPERQRDVVQKYAASTKEERGDLLGCFGLGMKSGLSYADSFTYTTRYEGMKYQYIMFKGEETTNIDKIYEQPTTERNGTEFRIQIKGGDKAEFVQKAKQQLCYFEKVYFKGGSIENNFKIIKNENWKHSTLNSDTEMHLCLDNVYYSIDWLKLGISPIEVPVGLNFKLGEGLEPIPSREDIKYTTSTKKLITDKIKLVADYFLTKYNESVTDVEDFDGLYGKFGEKIYEVGDLEVKIAQLTRYTNIQIVPLKMKGVIHLNVENLFNKKHNIFKNYEIRGKIQYGKFIGGWEERYVGDLTSETPKDNIILSSTPPKGVQLQYIKDLFRDRGNVRFLYKKVDRVLGRKFSGFNSNKGHDYYYLLDLKKISKENWRDAIKEFLVIEKGTLSKFSHLENLIPTKEWLDERKANRKKGNNILVGKEQVHPKWAYQSQRGNCNAIFTNSGVKELIELRRLKSLYVYGAEEDKEKLDQIFLLGTRNGRIIPVLLSHRDYDRISKANFHNWINISKFMEGNKPLSVFVTAFLINRLVNANPYIFSNIGFIRELSEEFADKLKQLSDYSSKNIQRASSPLVEELMKEADNKNWWDSTIYPTLKEVESKLGLFDFMEITDRYGNISSDKKQAYLKAFVDILKYRKVKLNIEHYKEPRGIIVPEVLSETPIESIDTEEAAEQVLEEIEVF